MSAENMLSPAAGKDGEAVRAHTMDDKPVLRIRCVFILFIDVLVNTPGVTETVHQEDHGGIRRFL